MLLSSYRSLHSAIIFLKGILKEFPFASPAVKYTRSNMPAQPKRCANKGDGDGAAAAVVAVQLNPVSPGVEVKRRAMQNASLQGWGLFYDMSYIDHILLPQAARLKLAICKTGATGSCLTEARIDWPDKSATSIPADIRLGAYL